MIKQMCFAAGLALSGALIGQLWSFGSLPADPDTGAQPEGTALDLPSGNHSTADPVAAAAALCAPGVPPATEAPVGNATDPTRDAAPSDVARAEACLLMAAADEDHAQALSALRQAAAMLQAGSREQADALLFTAASRGDAQALDAVGSAEPTDAADALWRREATLLAADAGAPAARQRIGAQRQALYGQALERPELVIALLEGRGLELADDSATRRYLLGLSGAAQRSCAWQAGAWDTLTFTRAREQFEAPLKGQSHVRVAGDLVKAAGQSAAALGRFAQSLAEGEAYVPAATDLMRQLRGAQRGLDSQAATTGEAGARDGVRVVELLGGCGTADGLRLVRALTDVFVAGATRMPSQSTKDAP
ncbi:MAG TPA: hypothetical protein VLJ86_00765 [Ramlibacter sp.]|nr:hypothetical protein [Ramlibacter sp.]